MKKIGYILIADLPVKPKQLEQAYPLKIKSTIQSGTII